MFKTIKTLIVPLICTIVVWGVSVVSAQNLDPADSIASYVRGLEGAEKRLAEVYEPYCRNHHGMATGKGVVGWIGDKAWPATVRCQDGKIIKAVPPTPAP